MTCNEAGRRGGKQRAQHPDRQRLAREAAQARWTKVREALGGPGADAVRKALAKNATVGISYVFDDQARTSDD